IVPGKPQASEVVLRVNAHDPDSVMPPPSVKKPLDARKIKTLERWIAAGAPYAGHWAFAAPVKPPLPKPPLPKPSAAGQAPRQPLDAFVVDRLQHEGLSPAPRAPLETLCRRIYLDLIGLPPEPRDVRAFVTAAGDNGDAAVGALVQRLLASPRYGERWARVWLDVARYADSNGFEKDLARDQWAWRDWVIDALNRDMPYDRFVIEQIAGDLLPGATQEQIIATGFLRNGMVNEEGAIVPEQFRVEGIIDRMDCLGKAVLGLSIQCAQCHSHKFDPITHDEYYGMFAFLNDTCEAQSWVYTPPQRAKISKLQADVRAVEKRLKASHPKWQSQLAAWESDVRRQQFEWTPLVATELGSTSGLNHPTQDADLSIMTLGHPTTKGDIFVIAEAGLQGVTGLRLEALCDRDLPFGGPGRSRYGTWAITEMVVTTRRPGAKNWEPLKLAHATADFSEHAAPLEDEWKAPFDPQHKRTRGPVEWMIDGDHLTAWRADRGLGRRNQEGVAVVQFEKPLDLPAGTQFKILLRYEHGDMSNGRGNVMLGRCRFSTTQGPAPSVPPIDYAAVLAIQTPADKRTPQQQDAIFSAWRRSRQDCAKFNAQIEKLWLDYPVAQTSVLCVAARDSDRSRETHLLDRGAWDQPKQTIRPHTPASLHAWPAGAKPDRLSLARWLADRRSPLAARVAVNRVWQNLFGVGLVETAEDFGTRAPEPEYREILDWLAVDFMEHGWSQKHLVRTILASATYQQSSRVTPALLQRDPRNQFLARGPRFRVDAEALRDVALAASGLIHQQLGGPSVFPPVPASVLEFNYFKPDYWNPPTDAQRYRRSLYVFRKRSMPDPVMSAFDAPNGDFACARRVRSNTPLAALTSLNEPVFVEAAQSLALRVLREGGSSDSQRVDYAFQLCTSRQPIQAERDAILAQLSTNLRRLRSRELKANDVAFSPLTRLDDLPADATPNDIAAWTLLGRVLLNLDETITKN
ncbi:MAG TPA: PSD1 and planctomycete cytochrome C domain-containing protein, partial [Pirellulales bacterium]